MFRGMGLPGASIRFMRGHGWALAASACLLIGLPAAPSVADEQRAGGVPQAHVIGDSVILGASDALASRGMDVDAVSGRRPTRLPGAVRKLPDDGRPVVVHLGTNGPFSTYVCDRLQHVVGDTRAVVLVTVVAPRTWTRETNDEIRQCADRIGAAIVPWHRLALKSPDTLYPDGIHLTPAGAQVLVEAVEPAVADIDAA